MHIPLFLFACFLGLVPVLMITRYWRRINDEARQIIPLVLLTAFSSLYEFVMTYLLGYPSSTWFRIYILLEFCAITFFIGSFSRGRKATVLIALALIFVVAYAGLWVAGGSIDPMLGDGYLTAIETAVVIWGSLGWFRDVFQENDITPLTQRPRFYFLSGLLLYFSGTAFLFLLANHITTNADFKHYWLINIIFNIVLRTLMIIGIWKGTRKLRLYSGQEPY